MEQKVEQAEKLNRRSYDAGGLLGVLKRTVRVLPPFALCALLSCALWYYVFHVPLERLGTIAAVPCVVGFVVMRILALVIPTSTHESNHPSIVFQALVVLSVFSAFVAVDFALSAVIYYCLGLGPVIVEASIIAGYSAAIAFVLIILAIVAGFPKLWRAILSGAVQLLRAQTKLTDVFFVPPSSGDKVA